jgi:hypothetical protein
VAGGGALTALAELPTTVAALAEAFPAAGRRLERRAALAWLERAGLPGGFPAFRSAAFQARFYFAVHRRRVVFFFLRREAPAEVVLDASVEFRLAAAEPGEPLPALEPTRMEHHVVAPRFLLPQVDASKQAVYAAALGVAPRELLFLRLDVATGHALMAFSGQPEAPRMVWRFPDDGGAEPGLTTAGLRRDDFFGYLRLAHNVADWVDAGFEDGVARPLLLPEEAETAPGRLLAGLITAYCDAVNGAGGRAGAAATAYEIEDFRARVELRLKPDGSLAEAHADQPFQLRASLTFAEDERGARSRIVIGPPDFLAHGPVHDALVDALDVEPVWRRLAGQLRGGVVEATPERVAAFLAAARRKQPLVFRCGRGADHDTDLYILEAPFADIVVTHLALEAKVQVAPPLPDGARRATVDPGSVRVLFASHFPATPRDLTGAARYFYRLVRHLRQLEGLLD